MVFVTMGPTLGGLFPSPLHQRLVTFHAKYPLRRPCIFEILNLLFATPTPKTGGAERLVSGEDGEILDFVPAGTAAICTVVTNEGAVAEEKEVGI
jgi:hypothetical protein